MWGKACSSPIQVPSILLKRLFGQAVRFGNLAKPWQGFWLTPALDATPAFTSRDLFYIVTFKRAKTG